MDYKLLEELSELITALTKYLFYTKTSKNQKKMLYQALLDELADVKAQIALFEEINHLDNHPKIKERMAAKYSYYKQKWQEKQRMEESSVKDI